jgi:hypothetical protein
MVLQNVEFVSTVRVNKTENKPEELFKSSWFVMLFHKMRQNFQV